MAHIGSPREAFSTARCPTNNDVHVCGSMVYGTPQRMRLAVDDNNGKCPPFSLVFLHVRSQRGQQRREATNRPGVMSAKKTHVEPSTSLVYVGSFVDVQAKSRTGSTDEAANSSQSPQQSANMHKSKHLHVHRCVWFVFSYPHLSRRLPSKLCLIPAVAWTTYAQR